MEKDIRLELIYEQGKVQDLEEKLEVTESKLENLTAVISRQKEIIEEFSQTFMNYMNKTKQLNNKIKGIIK